MKSRHELRERAKLLEELLDIIQAMKNIALAQVQRIAREMPALAQATGAVAQALADVGVAAHKEAHGPACWLVIGAERGFCGAFNAHLVAAVLALLQEDRDIKIWAASRRLVELLRDAGVEAQPLPGCAALEDAASVLDDWLGALSTAAIGEIWLMNSAAGGIQRRQLLPHPELPVIPTGTSCWHAPISYLPVPVVCTALERQAARLLLQSALYESLHEENHGRLAQMQFAQDHLEDLARALTLQTARQRQAEITNELETLTSSLPRA